MAIDPANLTQSELLQLVNSTPLGVVLTRPRLRRQMDAGALRFGDGSHIHLVRYARWLALELEKPRPVKVDYVEARRRQAQKNRAATKASQDIFPIPEIVDYPRRQACGESFRLFCETYFREAFSRPWSDDHLRVIAKIEKAVRENGLFAFAMPRGSGKALALDTPLPTSSGWTTMGQVQVGDMLFDDEGWPCLVTFVTEVQHGRSCYRVRFSDGEEIVCDAEHLWTVHDRYSRHNPLTLTTEEMQPRVSLPVRRAWQERRYRVPMTDPLRLPQASLEIDPYVLGYWLGDGTAANNCITVHANDLADAATEIGRRGEAFHVRARKGLVVTCVVGKGHRASPAETRRLGVAHAALECNVSASRAASWSGLNKQTVQRMRTDGYWSAIGRGERSSLVVRLRALGVLKNKHIPPTYLRAAPWQRLALLQGLMDTDGSINRHNRCEITLKDNQLGRDVGDLLSGLGLKWTCSQKFVELNGRTCGPYLRYNFSAFADLPVFRLPRKRRLLRQRPTSGGATGYRQIVSIEPVPSVPVRCIQVDSPTGLYLAGRKMVPTHNTTLARCAALWAVLYGYRPFVCLIGAADDRAKELLVPIRKHILENPRLLEDFPEAVHPLRALENSSKRQLQQHSRGRLTHVHWGQNKLVFPTIEGEDMPLALRQDGYETSPSCGSIITTTSLDANMRGQQHTRVDGSIIRPSLVLLDDPQTRDSARSVDQTRKRLELLNGDVLGMAGPGEQISALMTCTKMYEGDLADTVLDRDKCPEWDSECTRLVYSFPSDEKLWEEYGEVRRTQGKVAATEFYRERQVAMDDGAQIAWPHRFDGRSGEISAVQHAVNLKLKVGPEAFAAEYQNEPATPQTSDQVLTVDQVMDKVNGHQRGQIPQAATKLTMFIDVHDRLLFYAVCAWEETFTGYIVEYGTFPEQRRSAFTLTAATRTLGRAFPGAGVDGAIQAGLEELVATYLAREWNRGGSLMKIDRLLVDSGYKPGIVADVKRKVGGSAMMLSKGVGIRAGRKPLAAYARKVGEQHGHFWYVPNVRRTNEFQHVVVDVNYWKRFIHDGLSTAAGDRGCISLFGKDAKDGRQHELLAEHVARSEKWVDLTGPGGTVREWSLWPTRPDNHWFDCLVGCAAAASMCGVKVAGEMAPKRQRKRYSQDDLRRT